MSTTILVTFLATAGSLAVASAALFWYFRHGAADDPGAAVAFEKQVRHQNRPASKSRRPAPKSRQAPSRNKQAPGAGNRNGRPATTAVPGATHRVKVAELTTTSIPTDARPERIHLRRSVVDGAVRMELTDNQEKSGPFARIQIEKQAPPMTVPVAAVHSTRRTTGKPAQTDSESIDAADEETPQTHTTAWSPHAHHSTAEGVVAHAAGFALETDLGSEPVSRLLPDEKKHRLEKVLEPLGGQPGSIDARQRVVVGSLLGKPAPDWMSQQQAGVLLSVRCCCQNILEDILKVQDDEAVDPDVLRRLTIATVSDPFVRNQVVEWEASAMLDSYGNPVYRARDPKTVGIIENTARLYLEE